MFELYNSDMKIEFGIIIFMSIFGACTGSFLNVVAQRTIQGRKWWGAERSECDTCHKILNWYELIPIISYLIQLGRCRSCKSKIAPIHFFSELICMIGTGIILYKLKLNLWPIIFGLIIFYTSVLNSLTDIMSGDIYDLFAYAPGVLGIALRITGGFDAILDGVYAMVLGFSVFAVIILISRGGMGWGDAIFMAGAGGILGVKLLCTALYFGFMFGGVYSIILIILGRVKLGRNDSIPLVPFLAIGIFTTLIFYDEMLNYFSAGFSLFNVFELDWPFNF